jgi:ATP-dependent RNA helicase DDX55/SPB4
VRKIPVKPRAYFTADLAPSPTPEDTRVQDAAAAAFLARIRAKVLEDRALADRATMAFVSSVRAYATHEAAYIFRVRDLDLAGLACAYGLLRLPAMPELRGAAREGWADAELDVRAPLVCLTVCVAA